MRRPSASISGAVHAAEQMAGHQIDRAVVNLSGGYRASRIVKTEIAVGGREIGDPDMRQVLERGYAMRDAPDRQVIHSIPVGFSIDDSRGILDPRGMAGERLGVDMHIVTAAIATVRNHTAAARTRCISKPRRWSSALTPRVWPVSSRMKRTSASRLSIWAAARRRSAYFSAAI